MTPQRILAFVAGAAVAAAVVVGLVLVGTPGEQRLRRLDEQRASDLRRLVAAVDAYWNVNGALPAALEPLVDGRRLSALPRDPSTGAAYPYRPFDGSRYELCAAFDRPSVEADGFWSHGEGERCFSFDAAQSSSRLAF